uniref:NADH-ubiquinone oxidoreductase chain 1 n=1 Tax=Syphacia obvelata TaxID=412127 RepID=A0A0U3DF94_SYPOB|nr:NADH dehydrogenase subunit 1 [Syphacia obvelata]
MFILVLLIMVFLVQGVYERHLLGRHLLGGSQQRIGPNKVSFMGLLQPIFDGVKLIKKEQLVSVHSTGSFFIVIPGITFLVMYLEWFVIGYFYEFFTFCYSILMFLCLMGFSVYSFLLSGVVSKSKYGLLGAVRASNQSVSYEIIFSLYMLCIIVFWGSYMFVSCFGFLFVLFFLPFFVVILAELNRAPFDFSEGESELVSGYNVEYGECFLCFIMYRGVWYSVVFYYVVFFFVFYYYFFGVLFVFLFVNFCSYFLSSFSLWYNDSFFLICNVAFVFFFLLFFVGLVL